MRATLHRMNPRKATGADSWHFSELLALPDPLLHRLAEILNLVEREGCWPSPLGVILIALTPKEGATKEADLRPIGLTPMIYRLWMCLRKSAASQWTASLYGPRYLSAMDLAWATRAEQELARYRKHRFGVVFLTSLSVVSALVTKGPRPPPSLQGVLS